MLERLTAILAIARFRAIGRDNVPRPEEDGRGLAQRISGSS